MLEEVGAGELTEWQAFAEMEPFGCAVEDLRAGLAPAVTVNINRAENTEAMSPMDFFPWQRDGTKAEPVEPDTPEVLSRKLREMLTSKGKVE